jgi:hypothetical protein
VRLELFGQLENIDDSPGTRNRVLPAYSTVPEPSAVPRVTDKPEPLTTCGCGLERRCCRDMYPGPRVRCATGRWNCDRNSCRKDCPATRRADSSVFTVGTGGHCPWVPHGPRASAWPLASRSFWKREWHKSLARDSDRALRPPATRLFGFTSVNNLIRVTTRSSRR